MIFSRRASATAVAASSALFAPTLLVASTPVVKYSSPVASTNNGEGNVVVVVDAGILALSSSTPRGDIFGAGRVLQELCPEGYVDCKDGKLASDDTIYCSDACYNADTSSYDCCYGVYACYGFTGKVCKDGSCNGDQSCELASIPIVVDSCKEFQSCYAVGYVAEGAPANNVGNFINSCTGSKACYNVAYALGGGVGSLENSCTVEEACMDLGKGSFGPVTSNLKDCCTSNKACYQFSEQNIPAQCRMVSMLHQMSDDTSFHLC